MQHIPFEDKSKAVPGPVHFIKKDEPAPINAAMLQAHAMSKAEQKIMEDEMEEKKYAELMAKQQVQAAELKAPELVRFTSSDDVVVLGSESRKDTKPIYADSDAKLHLIQEEQISRELAKHAEAEVPQLVKYTSSDGAMILGEGSRKEGAHPMGEIGEGKHEEGS